MYNIPLFNEKPVIQAQQIKSASPGLDILAQGLKGAAQGTAEVAITAGNWRSNAIMYHEMAGLGQLEGQTVKNFELANSPEEVQGVMANYRTKSTELLEKSTINQNDRRTLSYMAGRGIMEMERTAGDLEARLSTKANKTTLFTDFTLVLQNFQRTLLTDVENGKTKEEVVQESAELLAQSMKPFDTALQSGMITQADHDKALRAFEAASQSATDLYNLAAEGNADAAAYHKYTYMDGAGVGKKPANFTTQGFQLDNQESGALDDAIANLQQGRLSGRTYFAMSPRDTIVYAQTFEGVRAAKALIGSNMPIPVIESRFTQLNNEKVSLTIAERAERDQLGRQLSLLKNDYQGFLDTTTLGSQLTQEYKSNINGIENSAITEQQKYNQLVDAKNQLTGDYVSLGKSMGIPTQYIKPVPVEDVQQITDAFKLGTGEAQIQNVVSTIDSYNQKNGLWLANSISDPDQAEIVQAASLARDTDSKAFIPTMILANQKGQDYSAVDDGFTTKHKGSATTTIQGDVATKLTPLFNYLSHMPNGGQRIQSILDDATNYVKFAARNNNDLTISNIDTYVNQAAQLFSDANPILAGNGYSFNTKIVDVSASDVKNIVAMVQSAVQQQRIKDKGAAAAKDMQENTSYTITNSPTGEIIAINQQGQSLIKPFDFNQKFVLGAAGFASKQAAAKQAAIANVENKVEAVNAKQDKEILSPQVETMLSQEGIS